MSKTYKDRKGRDIRLDEMMCMINIHIKDTEYIRQQWTEHPEVFSSSNYVNAALNTLRTGSTDTLSFLLSEKTPGYKNALDIILDAAGIKVGEMAINIDPSLRFTDDAFMFYQSKSRSPKDLKWFIAHKHLYAGRGTSQDDETKRHYFTDEERDLIKQIRTP